jgi:hypothetical protein
MVVVLVQLVPEVEMPELPERVTALIFLQEETAELTPVLVVVVLDKAPHTLGQGVAEMVALEL